MLTMNASTDREQLRKAVHNGFSFITPLDVDRRPHPILVLDLNIERSLLAQRGCPAPFPQHYTSMTCFLKDQTSYHLHTIHLPTLKRA